MTCGNLTSTVRTVLPWGHVPARPAMSCWGFGWAIEDGSPDRKPTRRRRPAARRRSPRKSR